jgi:hypothetical protein
MRAGLTLGHPQEGHRDADARHDLGLPHPTSPRFTQHRAEHDQSSRKLRSFRLRLGCFSLRSAFASICRMRSRVTLNC